MIGAPLSPLNMAHPIAPDYGQQFLLPPALEDWVPSDHPARFIREFVDQLDLGALGFVMPTAAQGRPPYAPSLLLKIWLHGYFHRIRSTRKLEGACVEQLPLVWLTGLIAPDHNSLWRFWRDNKAALRQIFKQTVQVAARTGAVGLVLQAVDGTKIEAAASGYSGWSKKYMEKLLAQLDTVLEKTELEVAQHHAAEEDQPGYKLPSGLAERKALRQEIQKGLEQLKADGREHYHPKEPEARRMKINGKATRFGYNAQTVADEKEGVLVACEVTREENDQGALVPMIEQTREHLGVAAAESQTLADQGYGTGADLQAAKEAEMNVLVPPKDGSSSKDNPYASRNFEYDPKEQHVRCPQGEQLDHEGKTTKKGAQVQRYRCHHRDCPVRDQCTKDPKGRMIEVWPHTPVVQAMRERLKNPEEQERWRKRGQIIERPFGQIKQHDGFRRWTVRGLEGVNTQWAMICATLNLRVLYRRWRQENTPRRPGAAGVLADLRLKVKNTLKLSRRLAA